MKKFIPIIGLAVAMVACNSNPNTTAATNTAPQVQPTPAYTPDTVGLTQFQQWKAANELASVKEYQKPVTQYAAPVKKTRTVYTAPATHSTQSTSNNGSTVSGSND